MFYSLSGTVSGGRVRHKQAFEKTNQSRGFVFQELVVEINPTFGGSLQNFFVVVPDKRGLSSWNDERAY